MEKVVVMFWVDGARWISITVSGGAWGRVELVTRFSVTDFVITVTMLRKTYPKSIIRCLPKFAEADLRPGKISNVKRPVKKVNSLKLLTAFARIPIADA